MTAFRVQFDSQGKAEMGACFFDDWRDAQKFIHEFNQSPSPNATLLNDLQDRVKKLEAMTADLTYLENGGLTAPIITEIEKRIAELSKPVPMPCVGLDKWDGVIRTDDDERLITEKDAAMLAKAKAECVLIEENPFPSRVAQDAESITLADDIENMVVCYDKGDLGGDFTSTIEVNDGEIVSEKIEKANVVAERVTKDQCFEELKKMHKASGLTIKDLAKGIGAPYSTVQSWFNSKNRTSLKEKLPKLRTFYTEQAKIERPHLSFKCDICGNEFPSLSALTGHKSSHSHIAAAKQTIEEHAKKKPVHPSEMRPYWTLPPQGYAPEAFKIDWSTCAQVISEAAGATSWDHLVNKTADRTLSEDRAFQILLKFDHLFQAARVAKNEGGEAVRNAKIEAQKELISIAKDGKVAFG